MRPAPLLAALLAPLLLAGCPAPEAESPAPTLPARGPVPIRVSDDSWVLSTGAPDGEFRGAYLGSGYLGQRVAATGAAALSGEQAHSYLAGLYAGESVVPLAPVLPLVIDAGARVFGADPAHLRNYRQELRLREGLVVTRATWDSGAGDVELELESAILRQQPDVALLRFSVGNRSRAPVRVGVPEGAIRPEGSPGDYATDDFPGVRFTLRLRPIEGEGAAWEGASPAGYRVAPGKTVRFAMAAAVRGGVVALAAPLADLPVPDAALAARWLDGHRRAWARLWQRDIEIEGDPEAQQVVRACLFQLLCSIRPENTAGIPPMGLSGNAFNGHVFWDMDSWMLPALLPQHPELARAMLEYRHGTLEGARVNAAAEGLPGAAYAWESALTGEETLQGEVFRHGRHVSGDVALAMRQYYAATGDREWLQARAWPVLQATADNWAARAKPDGAGGFVVRQVTTPDENAGLVDHSAWTHHVARVNLEFAAETAAALRRPAPPRWKTVAAGLRYLRRPDGLILSYAGFGEQKKAKQADALLLVHPGEASFSAGEMGRLYDFYAPRVIATGPAMTDAIHAIAAARLGRDQEALERFRLSYRPFVRPPYHVFSEKRTRDNLCFVTGAAGVVEAVLYGFAGLRLEPDPAQRDRPLLQPRLPAGWTALRLRGLRWRGRAWDVELKPGAAPRWTRLP